MFCNVMPLGTKRHFVTYMKIYFVKREIDVCLQT